MMLPARLDLLVLRDLTQQKAWEGSDLRQLVHWLLSIKLTVGPWTSLIFWWKWIFQPLSGRVYANLVESNFEAPWYLGEVWVCWRGVCKLRHTQMNMQYIYIGIIYIYTYTYVHIYQTIFPLNKHFEQHHSRSDVSALQSKVDSTKIDPKWSAPEGILAVSSKFGGSSPVLLNWDETKR